jgi:hypothetical protein
MAGAGLRRPLRDEDANEFDFKMDGHATAAALSCKGASISSILIFA